MPFADRDDAEESGLCFDLSTLTLSEYDEAGFLSIGTDTPGDGTEGSQAFEVLSPWGFLSRPPDPVDGKSATVATMYLGNERFAMVFGEPGATPKLPILRKGDTVMYASQGAFMRAHADGKLTLFTTADGKVDSTAPSVFFQIGPEWQRFTAPWGRQWFDLTGWHMFHSSGAGIDVGTITGLPAPFGSFGSYVDITGAMVRLKTSAVSIGVNPLTMDHLAHATPIVMAIQQLYAIVSMLATTSAAPGTAPMLGTNAALLTAALGVPSLTPGPVPLTAMVAKMVGEGALPATVPFLRSIVAASS